MGIVNVTPDSFSDGGAFLDAGAAIEHARSLTAEGAEILDIGGESTRPGAEPVTEGEELRRGVPVVAGLVELGTAAQVSIDTSQAAGARGAPGVGALVGVGTPPQLAIDTPRAALPPAARGAGASLVNDVSALRADRE